MKPQWQVALDATDLAQAVGELRHIAECVDIIEIGAVLAFTEDFTPTVFSSYFSV